jgi:TetR/AcrR family transcriptional regulator, transcriptional repressor for nem operon
MGKPTSALTTAISIRIPNDLLNAVAEHALSNGLLNESGRLDKRGQPNLSAAMSNLLKQALEQSKPMTSLTAGELSNSVSSLQNQPLAIELTAIVSDQLGAIENRLVDRVCDAVTQQLKQLLSHDNTPSADIIDDSAYPARSHREAEPKCESDPAQASPAKKEDTRDRILHAVSRGFRTRGYNGIGVDALAKDAGVTSGAFYGYFRSKEDAFLAAVVDGIDEYRAGIESLQANYGANWSVALADYYVGRKHRQDLACGCALPTLSPEVIRSDQRVRSAYQAELIKLNAAIAAGLATGTETEKRDTAWVILAVLAGGVTLARAVWDELVAEQIATAVHQATVEIAAGNPENRSVSDRS